MGIVLSAILRAVKRLAVVLVLAVVVAEACSSSHHRASDTGATCADHHHRAQAARLLSRRPDPLLIAAYVKACGTYSVGCKSAGSQSLDPKTGKPTGPMTMAAPECDYTREYAGRTETATLVKIGDQCWLRARGMPEIPAPCVPKEAASP